MGTLAEYSVVGFVFPVALVLGFLAGRWLGSLLGGPAVGAVVGVILGTAAGFYNLWETMQRIERREAERGTSDGPGDDAGQR
ncbi:MAG: AtpZ/AtpI family protein [Acidobacteriota bacterium]